MLIGLTANAHTIYIDPRAVVAIEPDDDDTVIHLNGGTIARTLMTADQVAKVIERATSNVLDVGSRITFDADADVV